MGSNGEYPHLDSDERRLVTATARSVLDKVGCTDSPVIAGCSGDSVRGTVQLCKEAAAAGADYALILPPSYFKRAMSADAIFNFYTRVADSSPLGVILYSFPAVSAGLEMDSDLLIRISQHPNVVGTKITCGDTGKLLRVAVAMDAATPDRQGSGYVALGGLADFGLQALVAGGSGFIAGGANVTPKVCVKLFKPFEQGKWTGAMELQKKLGTGDWIHTKAGIAETKSVLQHSFGYSGVPRQPLLGAEKGLASMLLSDMHKVLQLESSI